MYKLETCSLVIEFVEVTPSGKVEITLPEIYKGFNFIKKLKENKLMHRDIKLDNFIADRNKETFLINCMKYNGSVELALNYDLMGAIYCLRNKCDASLVLGVSQKFFSSTEVCDALKLLYFTCARLDSIFEKKEQTKLY